MDLVMSDDCFAERLNIQAPFQRPEGADERERDEALYPPLPHAFPQPEEEEDQEQPPLPEALEQVDQEEVEPELPELVVEEYAQPLQEQEQQQRQPDAADERPLPALQRARGQAWEPIKQEVDPDSPPPLQQQAAARRTWWERDPTPTPTHRRPEDRPEFPRGREARGTRFPMARAETTPVGADKQAGAAGGGIPTGRQLRRSPGLEERRTQEERQGARRRIISDTVKEEEQEQFGTPKEELEESPSGKKKGTKKRAAPEETPRRSERHRTTSQALEGYKITDPPVERTLRRK